MSGNSQSWCVRSSGQVMEGFDQASVVGAFARTFKVDEIKAAAYLEPGKLISEGLDEADADRYRIKLEGLGLAVTLHGPSGQLVDAVNAIHFAQTGHADATADAPVVVSPTAAIEPTLSSQTVAFSCPKCLLVQEKSEQCTGCGIFFEKYARRSEPSDDAPAPAAAPARSWSVGDSDISIAALGAAAVAALLFAFIWKFVALQFDRELGLIAWAAGGAIGGAAVLFGARGMASACICGALVVASIFLGKYLYVSSYLDESLAYMGLDGDQTWVDVYYDEIASEREIYASVPKDDQSIKQFMIDYDYTEAGSPASVSADDYGYFKAQVEPWLVMPADSDPDRSSTAPEAFQAALSDAVSPWTLVKETLGPIDLLFLLFGVSTAFRMVQSSRGRGW